MPKKNKYAGIIQSLTQAQNAVAPLLTSNNPVTQQVSQAINTLTQSLIKAGQARLLSVQLIQSAVSIGTCVLKMNGQTDINHPDCLPIPQINSRETFALGIIVLQLLFALNPRKDHAIQDYLKPLNLAADWRQRLNRSPMALINKLQSYYLDADPDSQQELLELFPESLDYIVRNLQTKKNLLDKTIQLARTKHRSQTNTTFFQYNPISDRDAAARHIEASRPPPQTTDSNTPQQLTTLSPITTSIYNATYHGFSQYVDPRTTELLNTLGINAIANIQQAIRGVTYERALSTTSSEESEEPYLTPTAQLQDFLTEVEEINARLQELFAWINTNNECIKNYLQAVQDKLAEYTNDPDPNKHIYFGNTHKFEVSTETYFQNYKSLEEIKILNDEISRSIARLPKLNNTELPRELADIPKNNLQSLHEQQDIILTEAENIDAEKAQAIQHKRELYTAIKESPPLIINNQIFSASSAIPPWYLRALTYKVLPYLSAFIFTLSLAATIICTGLMLNSPAFIVFSLKTINHIVTPLCISGITLGGTAAIISGTGLISACMFSNLRRNPDKLINASAPAINTLQAT